MRGHGECQSLEIVASFKQADEPAACMACSTFHKLSGRPVEIVLLEVYFCKRVAVMCVEASRDDDEIGRKVANCRQNAACHGLAKNVASSARRKRCVDNVAGTGLGECAGARIKRHLVRRAVKHRRIIPEDILRAIAVMDIPIDDGNALGAMLLLCMPGGYRGMIEQAKTHRRGLFGMVAGRTRCHEDIVCSAGKYIVDRRIGCADGGERRLPALRADCRISVDAGKAALGNSRANLRDE